MAVGVPVNPPGSAAPPAADTTIASDVSTEPVLLYVFDRERGGWYSTWSYPIVSSFGTKNPFQGTIYPVGDNLLMAGGDGNIYLQATRMVTPDNVSGTFDGGFLTFTQDAGSVDVTSTVRTRKNFFGDGGMQKQIRRYIVSGFSKANSASLTHYVYDSTGALSTTVSTSNVTIPFQTDQPNLDLGVASDAMAYQTEVSAINLHMNSIDIIYRVVRFAAGRLP